MLSLYCTTFVCERCEINVCCCDKLCIVEFPPVRSIFDEPNGVQNISEGPGDGNDSGLISSGIVLAEHLFDSFLGNNIPSRCSTQETIADCVTSGQIICSGHDNISLPEQLRQSKCDVLQYVNP